MTSAPPVQHRWAPPWRMNCWPRLAAGLYAAVWLGVLLVSLHAHLRAGLTLPNPWNDEAWNLWQAKAVIQTGTFQVPELNPDHPSMLYGGGYAAAVGLFMRVFGFSLESARHFSWLCMAGAWSLTALILSRLPGRLLGLALAGLFFLAPAHVVAANTARPEALILLLTSLGFWRLLKGAPLQAVFLCGLGVIVHPNSLYFLLGTLAYVASSPALWPRLRRPSRSDAVVMILCLLPVLLSAGMILHIWEHWISFFRVQLAHNATYQPMDRLFHFRWWLAALAGSVLASRLLRLPAAVWLLYGLMALLAALMGGEMWYDVYKVTGFMAMLTGWPVLLAALGRWGASRHSGRPGQAWSLAGGAAAAACLLALGNLSYRHGLLVGPRHYPQKLSWGWGMVLPDPDVPYLTPEDRRIVSDLAMRIAGDHPAPVVEFPGTGDSFLFGGVLPPRAIPRLRIDTKAPSQVVVFHLSRYIPPWKTKYILRDMAAWGIDPAHPDFQRDETEKWFVRPARPAGS